MKKLLMDTTCPGIVEAILQEASRQDSTRFELDFYWDSPTHKDAWRNAFDRLFGERTCIASCMPSTNSQAEWEGWTILHPHPKAKGLFLGLGVPRAEDVVAGRQRAAPINTMTELTPSELKVFHHAMQVVSRCYMPIGQVKVVEGLQKGGWEIDGQCIPDTDTIYVNRCVLSKLELAVQTLLHESIHKHTGAGDCDASFQREACWVAAQALLKGVRM